MTNNPARFVLAGCSFDMETTATVAPTDADFRALIPLNKYVRLDYFTDIREFIRTDALVKRITTADDTEQLELVTGEQIPLDRIIRIDGHLSPNYPGYDDYSCSC